MIVNYLIYLHGIILILIKFYEFGDVKDLADVKYHFKDTVVVVTLYDIRGCTHCHTHDL